MMLILFLLLKSVLRDIIPRKNSRGGGVGMLLKKNIRMKTQSQTQFMSFEYIDVIVKFSNTSTRMVIIYRPPPSKKNQLNNTFARKCGFRGSEFQNFPGQDAPYPLQIM